MEQRVIYLSFYDDRCEVSIWSATYSRGVRTLRRPVLRRSLDGVTPRTPPWELLTAVRELFQAGQLGRYALVAVGASAPPPGATGALELQLEPNPQP